MLTELFIENFALIDRMTVTFSPGLNVLTGETGAGKSIVIDAINVLLGERAGTELVRTGAARALLQATFDLSDAPHLLTPLAALGVEPEEGLLMLAREVAREGKNVARINGRACPVSIVRQVGDLLVDLHGQHEHQSLLREEHHLHFLDALGDAAFARLREEVGALARQRAALRQDLADLRADARDRLRTIDLLTFQLDEIDTAHPLLGEDDELAAERLRLANAERLHAAAEGTYRLLYDGADGSPSVLDALSAAQAQLHGLLRYDAALEPLAGTLESAVVSVSEVSRELAAYRDGVQFDPERLEEIEERLSTLNTLKRKYGESLEAVLAYAATKRAELDRLTHSEERQDELLAAIARCEARLAEQALALSAQRKALADGLSKALQAELAHLGMPNARFTVQVAHIPHADGLPIGGDRVVVTASGIDAVAFHLSANAGEPPKPLARVASGGELSRIMLALKAVAARGAGVPTLIFDEIDTGIGGRTAETVGAKLAQVAREAQTICVTHLAQIAFYGGTHFLIEKAVEGERTVSRMRALRGDDRVHELARLQAGGRVSEAVLAHVRDVLYELHGAHTS